MSWPNIIKWLAIVYFGIGLCVASSVVFGGSGGNPVDFFGILLTWPVEIMRDYVPPVSTTTSTPF